MPEIRLRPKDQVTIPSSIPDDAHGKALFTRENFITVLRYDASVFGTAAQVRAASAMKMIDALHYSTALRAGCRILLTNDGDFKPSNQLGWWPFNLSCESMAHQPQHRSSTARRSAKPSRSPYLQFKTILLRRSRTNYIHI